MEDWVDTEGDLRADVRMWKGVAEEGLEAVKALCRDLAEMRERLDRLERRIEILDGLRGRAYEIVSKLLPDDPRVQNWLRDAVEF